MAMAINSEKSVRSMQWFMKTYHWDYQAMLRIPQDMEFQSLAMPMA